MKEALKIDFNSKNQTKIILHILVWFMFFSIPLYDIVFGDEKHVTSFILAILVFILSFYTNFVILVPKFLITKNFTFYFLCLLVLFLIHCVLFFNIEPHMPNIKGNNIPPPPPDFKSKYTMRLLPAVMSFFLMISVSSFLKIYEYWNENFKKQKEIENENRTSELNFLKSQLNPHFFFNSLNTIYSLSISQSKKTPEAILNLSELMRYMLLDRKENAIDMKVKLKEEINYISNYIELQKLRITPNNKIDFKVNGAIDKVEIYPLLFISFIENAFKYGVHPIDESTIKIEFVITDNSLLFEVTNDLHFQKTSYDSFGLGNENSIRRLNLYYPDNVIKIHKEQKYSVSLLINLNEN